MLLPSQPHPTRRHEVHIYLVDVPAAILQAMEAYHRIFDQNFELDEVIGDSIAVINALNHYELRQLTPQQRYEACHFATFEQLLDRIGQAELALSLIEDLPDFHPLTFHLKTQSWTLIDTLVRFTDYMVNYYITCMPFTVYRGLYYQDGGYGFFVEHDNALTYDGQQYHVIY